MGTANETATAPDGRTRTRTRIVGIYVLLAMFNLAAWAAAFAAFHAHPALLGTALLAYGLGLRHAVDADHIAAIDNVTRKLMQEGGRPVAVGFFFSLGHSTIVALATAAIAATATAFRSRIDTLHGIGGVIGTIVSVVFLLAIAIMNGLILRSIWTTFRRVRAGGRYDEEDPDALLAGRGLLCRLLRPLFRLIRASWHMYPLGVLFGLGFDTATEVGLLGLSTAGAAHGMSIWSIMAFPALFAAGMSLVDTTDGVLMLSAYAWAFVEPIRKLYYNLTITAVSVLVALLVGGIEALGLVGDQLDLRGWFWTVIGRLDDHFGALGTLVVGLFMAAWLLSFIVYRIRGYDAVDAGTAGPTTQTGRI